MFPNILFLLVGESKTWGHSLRIRDQSFRAKMRKLLHSKVVNLWNFWPQEGCECSINTLKSGTDSFLVLKESRDMGNGRGNGVEAQDQQ